MADSDEKKRLINAVNFLRHITETEDHCDNELCTIDTPECEVMEARAAEREIMAVLDPPMTTMAPERLNGYRERIFVDEWIKENTRGEGMGGNQRLLGILLSERRTRDGEAIEEFVSQRDAKVATTVLQWLGTNCGQSFLHTVNQRINKEYEENKEAKPTYHIYDHHIRDVFAILEDRILQDIIPLPFNAENFKMSKELAVHLRHEIKHILRILLSIFAFETGDASAEECGRTAGFHKDMFLRVHGIAKKAVRQRVNKLRAASLAKAK